MTNIETDVQKHADSLTAHRNRLDLAEIEIDTKQNQLTAAQLVRLDSVLAGGYRISVTSAGNIKIITFDSTGLFDAYGGVMVESDPTATSKAQDVVSDSLDAAIDRAGGGSKWTDGAGYIYRDGPVTIGGTQNPISQQVGLYLPRNIRQHPDSTADLGAVRTPRVIWDTLGVQQSDTLRYWVESVKEPKSFIYKTAGTYSAAKQGSVTFVIPADMQLGSVTGAFRVDSAAGVAIQQIRQRGVGGRATLIPGYQNFRAEIEEAIDVSATALAVNWGSTSAQKAPRLRGVASNPSNYVRPFSVMGVGGNASDAYGLITVEVVFIMPASSTSSWYVTIDRL
jgi:hypothetical protein